jgi:UDP-N-acetylglucosamine--N-acetylmuramyl-(pentapeptide) pyrophosphoryl-undecaprenol N-acetylglucosamine transferase
MSTDSISVLFAGGGTGGHLFPGIAVAHELRRRHPEVELIFVGAGRTLEARVISREGFALEQIRTSGLVGQSWAGFVKGLALIPVSLVDAAVIIHRFSPRLVVGLGGYSSGPMVMCAALQRLPTMVMEQNSVPGMTNRLLARFVHASAVPSETALPYFVGTGFVSGNPVRAGFFDTPRPKYSPLQVHVLVVGGSQGAHEINVSMVAAAPTISASSRHVRITHQTGERDVAFVRDGYSAAGITARVEPFLEEMEREMAMADLIVCRAGATTLAEVAASGRAAILVPFPHAAHDHQRRNAEVVVDRGGAEMIDQRELSGSILGNRIIELASDDGRRKAMADANLHLARPDATTLIVDRMESLLSLL